ncbi:hypothetical protein SBADM41S_09568 [Streptomyces badius]
MSATRYAYLGPEGTFTEVALRTLPEAATRELVPMLSVPAALDAVRIGEAAAALVPIENSVEGGITDLMLIQSRPTGEGIGNYCFAVDAEGHIADRRVGEALMGLKRISPKVRFLGSYPRAGVSPDEVRPLRAGTSDAAFTEASDWLARSQDGRI